MNLHEYLSSPGALTVAQLREKIGALSDAQIRQWQHGYAGRKPSFDNCVAIELATGGLVTVEELRPGELWMRIADPAWPNLQGRPVLDFIHRHQIPSAPVQAIERPASEPGKAGLVDRREVVRRADDVAKDAELKALKEDKGSAA